MNELYAGRIDGFKNFFNIFKLSDLESALQQYKGTSQYDAAIRYYNGCIVGLASDKELEPVGLLRDVLTSLQSKSRRRRSTETQVQGESDMPEALELIVDKLDDYARRKTNSQNILKLGRSEVPRQMHFVWLGGGIGAIQKDYINIWKQVMAPEGFALNLWFDRDALLAHKTNQVIVAAAKADALSFRNGRADDGFDLADDYVARARVLKQQMFDHINEFRAAGKSADEARIDLLVKAYGQDEKVLRDLRNNNEQSVRELANEQFFLRDLQDPSNALPLADIYHREIALRMNLAAASDVVRFPVQYVEGGIYSDVDYLPPFADKLAGIEVDRLSKHARIGVLQLLLKHNPQWMPGRDSDRYKSYIDSIPQAHRATLEEYANSLPSLNDVFVAPKSLNVEADGVRAAIIRDEDNNPEEIVDIRMNNSFLMSHPGSEAMKAVLDRIQLSYDMMDTAEARLLKERGTLEPGELYETAQSVIEQTLENFSLPELEMYRVSRYVQAVVQYHYDGISPESGATIYISGPAAMRAGMTTFAAAHFTPEGAKKWAGLINLNEGFNNDTEEEQDHTWQENRGIDQWLAKELTDWQQGNLITRYQGNVNELLKRRTITFENGWPLIEGRHVRLTDILQHLADGLGEPFLEAMNHEHSGEVTFHADVSLSFDQRQQILAQAPGVGALSQETDERSLSLDRMLERIASNELQMTHLSPGQKLLLGSVFDCTTLDNTELSRTWPEIETMAQGISGLGISSRYAAIERELLKRNNAAFAAGMASASGYTPAHVDDAFKMKKQALEEPSTLREWGSRVTQIQKVALLQYREEINARMSLVLGSFSDATHAIMPQDLLLDGVGERIGGRCVPLSLAVAVALQKGPQASRNLYEKFYLAVGEPNAVDSTLFLQSLDALQDAPLDKLGQLLPRSDLMQAIKMLEQGASSRTFMLNSDNHAMLLGKTLHGGRSFFHFYDPNFGVFQFEDLEQFSRALEEFFIGHKMADFYAAYGEPGRATFDLVDIDGTRLRQWPLPSGGHVSDLVEETALPGEPQTELLPRLARARGRSLSGNPRLGRSLMELDGRWWAGEMVQASTQLREQNQLGPEFVPLFQTMEKTSADAYEISLINPKDPQQIRRVTTGDSRLWKIKNYLLEKFESLRKPQGPAEPTGVHTLNTAFALQALIRALTTHEAAATEGSETPLAMAVRLHGYVSAAQFVHGTVSDIVGVIELVQRALVDERLIAQTTKSVAGEALGRVAGEGVGALFGLINVGFDAYELANAQNDVQKAQFGTQLAFDTAGVVLMVGGFAAGGTVGAFLGGGGVILGGLAIGVAALAQGFALIAEEAKQVGLYFHRVDQAYREGGYTQDAVSGSMTPKPIVVFKTIDFRNKTVHFGSPALFPLRDHFGVPDYDVDYTRATDIRQGLGLPETAAFTPADMASIVLPCVPATYIGYRYKTLPGATNRHDLGFDIARKLEKKNAQGDWQFLFDFWSFPGEYILYQMFPTYRATTIRVLLDDVERSLIVPKLPSEWHGLITYDIEARQGRCAVVLNPGVALNLKAAAHGSMHWELLASWASEGDVTVMGAGTLSVGDTHIRLAGGTHDLLLRLKNDQTVRVDWQNKQLLIVEQDGLADFGAESLVQHLAALSREHRLVKPYTLVHDYLIPFEPVDEPRRTNAYYDVDRDRLLYVRDIDDVFADEAILGGVIGDQAFFYTPDGFYIWQVDAVTGLPIQRYRLLVAKGSTVSHCGVVEGGVLQVVQKMTRADHKVDELTYVLHEQHLYLTSVSGDLDAQVEVALAVSPFLAGWEVVLAPYSAIHFSHAPEGTVDWLPADIVSICWRSPGAQRRFAWVRGHDGLIIRSRLPDKFISPSLTTSPDFKSIDLDDARYSRDLSLVLVDDTPEQVAVIYDRSTQNLYRQIGQRPAGSKGSPVMPIASRVKNVISTESGHVVATEDGLFFNLSPEGTLQLAGVNEAWVKEHPQWWEALPAVAEKYPVSHFAILGLMNYNGEARMGAWYMDGRLLLVDAGRGKELRLLGLTPDKQAAWVFDLAVGEIYRQPFAEPERLKEMFAEGTQVLHREGVPSVQPEWAHWFYTDVVRQGAGLQATTHEGLLMMLNDHETACIVGVKSEWVGQQNAALQEGLRALVSEYSHAPFLSVAGVDTFQWYVSATDRLISVPRKLEPVELLGTQHQSNVLLFDTADGRLHTYPMEMTTGPLNYVQRHDEVLSVEGQGRLDDLLPLLPDDVTTLVLRLGQGVSTCRVSTVAWLRLESIIVECRGSLGSPNPIPGKLIWDLESPEKVLVSLFDEHLIFIDPDTGHSLIFREIHAEDAALRGQVILGLKGYPLFDLETLAKSLQDKNGPGSNGLLGDLLRAMNRVTGLQRAA